MQTLILDGSNLCHEGQQRQGRLTTLGALLPCLRALHASGNEAYVIFDASFRYRLKKGSKAAADFETLLKKDEKVDLAPATTKADSFILEFAALRDFGVLSNDSFRDYVSRKGKTNQPHYNGKPVTLHTFKMAMGGFIIPSLKISYLIDEGALDVADIIAARAGAPPPTKRPTSAGEADVQESAGDRPSTAPAPLDFLLELSPLFLRAGDVFEVHRRISGKAWKAGNSKKTAEEFARECFGQEVVYLEPEGRKRNDGYFFDARYGDNKHTDVRSHLLDVGSRMLPLIASARTRVLALLELVHASDFAPGFNYPALCARAEELDIAYYERYVRSLLWALIASDGVRGTDENETDIAVILKGEMRVNPDESRADMLNFLQRGILSPLVDSENRLPAVVRDNLRWMLQLPKDDKLRRTIVKGHLEWLALEET